MNKKLLILVIVLVAVITASYLILTQNPTAKANAFEKQIKTDLNNWGPNAGWSYINGNNRRGLSKVEAEEPRINITAYTSVSPSKFIDYLGMYYMDGAVICRIGNTFYLTVYGQYWVPAVNLRVSCTP